MIDPSRPGRVRIDEHARHVDSEALRAEPLIDTLEAIQQRVLWLAVRMVDQVNRKPAEEIKVGGHQASSASIVSIMTALWFGHLRRHDMVAVKPHASPTFHAIKYLTGQLDQSWLTTLRQRDGLQAYPSRTKDPDAPDFSTGSVGLGAVAPLFSAVARRYVEGKFGETPPARFFALVGDAELDEGNVWEAIADPVTARVGNFTLIVDLNRQSLDRVVPDIQVGRLSGFFDSAGWDVRTAKYGRRLGELFGQPGGDALRFHLDTMTNEAYQQLFTLPRSERRPAFLVGADAAVRVLVSQFDDDELLSLITDLGGHDLAMLLETFRACHDIGDQPSVVFAYTIKGWGLPFAGDPLNHSMTLTQDQVDELRKKAGLDPANEWDRFGPHTAEGLLCESVGARLASERAPKRDPLPIPTSTLKASGGSVSTQAAFGRTLRQLADISGVAEHIVTVAPDVSVSTNLGGWINKVGVYSLEAQESFGGEARILNWAPSPDGQHIELGISEMNLFMLLGQLGLSHEHHGHQLLPVGTVYDPFVLRGLDAFIYGAYNSSRFVIAGTPSGVTLAPEGGAHQSTVNSSLGTELPNVCFVEPCFALEVDWLVCDALAALGREDGESTYLRLSTRPIDQKPFDHVLEQEGENRLRDRVLAGGYRLIEPTTDAGPRVTLVTTGALVPETIEAASVLDAEGVRATVIHLTSPDRAFRSWQRRHRAGARTATIIRRPSLLHELIPAGDRSNPVVSVHDASSHSLAWIGSALATHQIALGVDQFGESGSISDLYEIAGISTGDIVNAALIGLHESVEGR